ncbi:secreted RxLR effector protein 161-like [Rutidosis leptorrhynchoides]|uniref:secreted RxLR effector protein 161-like n=1 Tax=Rutidosis leptorrhynchoides TaxID=125765 RepID=UPI003A9A1FFE
MVGNLIYLTITRLEIAYSVGIVSQFMQCPTNVHLDAAKRILRYVKGSMGHGLWYKKCNDVLLNGFIDADWMGDANDRHSTSGYCFNMSSMIISLCSKKQDVIALSSTEAEYIAATMAAQECTWLRRLIGDILEEVDYVVKLKCDNESAIKLALNPVFHARTKHIEMWYHFIREKVLSGKIELANVRTNDQVADIFTKALTKAKFMKFREALRIFDREFALRGSVKILLHNSNSSGSTCST